MPSVNTGKHVIKSIKVYKDHVTISFLRDKIQVSKEAYLSTYLYIGKNLTKKEIDKLLEITAFSALLNYALGAINKKRYSERKMFEKLKAKEDNKQAIFAVINKLKASGLLNDKELMDDLIAYDHERLFGKNKILKHLKEQGITDELINKAVFSHSQELKKAKGLIPKLDKKYSRYGSENRKKHVYQALLVQGFDSDIAKEAVNLIKEDKPQVEKEKLKRDYQKIKNRYMNKYEGYELKQKIYAALANKGYKHQMIKIILEENDYENDF